MSKQTELNDTAAENLAVELAPLLAALERVLTRVLKADQSAQARRVLDALDRGSRRQIPAAEIEASLYRLVRDLVTLRNARLVFEADPETASGARVVSANAGAVTIGLAMTALQKMSAAIAPELVLSLAKLALRTDREQREDIGRMIARRGLGPVLRGHQRLH